MFVELLISHFYEIFPNEPREGNFDSIEVGEDSEDEDVTRDEHDHDQTEEEMSETEGEYFM